MTKLFAGAVALAALLTASASAVAAVKTQVVEYKQGDTTLEGLLAWDETPCRANAPASWSSPRLYGSLKL